MEHLKLLALDPQDLEVVSAHLQDGALTIGDMIYLPRDMRFAAVVHRFDWLRVLQDDRSGLQRVQSALRFDRVVKAQCSGIDLRTPGTALSLLAIRFEPHGPDDPGGIVTLCFSGKAAVRLEVECIEVEMKDLGPAWKTRRQPIHPDDDASHRG